MFGCMDQAVGGFIDCKPLADSPKCRCIMLGPSWANYDKYSPPVIALSSLSMALL